MKCHLCTFVIATSSGALRTTCSVEPHLMIPANACARLAIRSPGYSTPTVIRIVVSRLPARAPLDVPQSSVDAIFEPSLTNFNADPQQEFVRERDLLREVLKAAW